MPKKVLGRPLPDASIPRNAFDRSYVRNFNHSVGMLLPVFCEPVIAGSTIKLNRQIFERTADVNTAAFNKLDTHIQFYAVKLKYLYSRWDDFKLNIQDLQTSAYNFVSNDFVRVPDVPSSIPTFDIHERFQLPDVADLKDGVGYSWVNGALRLLDLLGYNGYDIYADSPQMNTLRLQAYQKVYFDHFRNTAYESNNPFAYNSDLFVQNNGSPVSEVVYNQFLKEIMTLRYVNYRKDYFQNIYPALNYVTSDPSGLSWQLPSSLVGATGSSSFNVSGSGVLSGSTDTDFNRWFDRTTSQPMVSGADIISATGGTYSSLQQSTSSNQHIVVHRHDVSGTAHLNTSANLNINPSLYNVQAIRASFALDKLLRSSAYAPKHARDQYKARYGISGKGFDDHLSDFIGAFMNDITIGEVVSTSDTLNGDVGNRLGAIGGKGIGSGDYGRTLEYTANEDSLIVGVCYTIPRTQYDGNRYDNWNMKSVREDFFIPEYMDLGLQPLYRGELYEGDEVTRNFILGYVPRYQEYKLGIDVNNGLFINGESLSPFVVHTNAEERGLSPVGHGVNNNFFKVTPSDVDSLFVQSYDGEQRSDQIYSNCRFMFVVNCNMSVHGQPRL